MPKWVLHAFFASMDHFGCSLALLIVPQAGDFDNLEGLKKQTKSYVKDAMIYCKISISNLVIYVYGLRNN